MEIKKGFKNTEVGEVPENWRLVKFHEVSFLKGRIGWQGLKQTEFTNNLDEPFLITGMNFKNGEIKWDEVYHVSEERYNIAKEIQLKANDVLMTKDGTIGKLLFVDKIPYPHKATLNSHLLLFRPLKKSYHPKYLYYNLASPFFNNHIEMTKSGSTFFGVSQESVGEYNLLLPDYKEQTAIAEALSDMDALISQTEKLIEKKKAIKQGAMQELLTPTMHWELKKFTDVVNYIHGKAHEQNIVKAGKFVVVNSKFISTNGDIRKFSDQSFCTAKKGDVLTVLSDLPNGKALAKCFYVDSDNQYAVNQRICIWRSKSSDPKFLYYLLNRHDYFLSLDDGVSQTHILNSHIENFQINIPTDITEQSRIAEILWDMDIEITALNSRLKKIQHQKQGMMQSLLTGKIRLI